jgi:hypothetical protein
MGGAIYRDVIGSRARIVLLACAALLIFGLAAGEADAKKKKKPKKAGPVVTVSQLQNIAPEQNGTAVATCPAGTTVVSGGFTSGPLDAANFLDGVVVNQSRMAGNGWEASAANLSDTKPGTVSAYAYCRGRTKPLVAVSASFENCFCTPKIAVVATCPTGLKPAAGGFSGPLTFAEGGAVPQMSDRFGAVAWKFSALDEGLNPSTITAYAYCVPKARLQTTGVRVIEGENAVGTAYAQQCKRRDKKMLGGGFTAENVDFAFGPSFQIITGSTREGGRWATSAMESLFGPGALQSSGYCG